MRKRDSYLAYQTAFAKVASGKQLDDRDFGESSMDGFTPFDEENHTAVTMGAQDSKVRAPLKSRAEFQNASQTLLGRRTP